MLLCLSSPHYWTGELTGDSHCVVDSSSGCSPLNLYPLYRTVFHFVLELYSPFVRLLTRNEFCSWSRSAVRNASHYEFRVPLACFPSLSTGYLTQVIFLCSSDSRRRVPRDEWGWTGQQWDSLRLKTLALTSALI